jgi:hypothetical protein
MDTSLNNYINRTIEIVEKTNNLSNKERKRDQNEMKQMILCIETTLLQIKSKYKKYVSTAFTKEIEKKEPTLLLKTINNTSLYVNQLNRVNLNWIQEINQYSLKINNLVLFGNIGNIYDKKILLNDKIQAHQVVECMHKNACKNILSEKYCKYFHNPLDLLKLKNEKLISNEFYETTCKFVRCFSNVSWVYSSDYSPNTRCIGSKCSLLNDIQIASVSQNYKINIENMKQQVMHDLLILLVLNEHNLA